MALPLELFLVVFLLLGPRSVLAYEIFLDRDDDPATPTTYTEEISATVRVVLSPSEPGEVIETGHPSWGVLEGLYR